MGLQGSGITMLTQIAHGLRSNGSMDFEDINEVVPWFHAALLCGQNLDEAQAFKPRLYKTHQLQLLQKTFHIFHRFSSVFIYFDLFSSSSRGMRSSQKTRSSSFCFGAWRRSSGRAIGATATALGATMRRCPGIRSARRSMPQGCLPICTLVMRRFSRPAGSVCAGLALHEVLVVTCWHGQNAGASGKESQRA